MDILLQETGNGGDCVFTGKDCVLIEGWQNMPYLGMFGGNIEGVTKEKLATEESKDWWGNSLLTDQDKSIQFNSETERILTQIAFNSAGRNLIEQTIKKDLEFMRDFATTSVVVSLIDSNKAQIKITVKKPESSDTSFVFIWDSTLQYLAEQK